MEKFTLLVALLAYGVALVSGTCGRYFGEYDQLDNDDVGAKWDTPFTRLLMGCVTAIGSLLGAAIIYHLVVHFTSSPINGWAAAVTALVVRRSLSRWGAQRLFSLQHEAHAG
jgi:hypothetical protein